VLPLNDLSPLDLLKSEFKAPVSESGQYVYYPGTTQIPERSAANTHGVSFKVHADVEFTEQSEGVIFAHGSRFGGHALYIKDGEVHYVYNFLGLSPEQHLKAPAPREGRHVVGIEFSKKSMGRYKESFGPATLFVDDQPLANADIRTMTGHFSITGEGLCIGFDSGDPVSTDYTGRFAFNGGGHINQVVFDIGNDLYVGAAMARD
jgi:arylsulfatase